MRKLTVVATLVAVLALVAASSATASTIRVTGVQSPPDTTAGQPGDLCRAVDPLTGLPPVVSNTMAGSLIGCWYTDTFEQVKSSPNGEILAIGTEHFVGCIDVNRDKRCSHRDPQGILAIIYAFEGQFDKNGKEIRGGCQHPILSGTGDFKGARGRLNFTDNVANGTSDYLGRITLAKKVRATRARASAARVMGAPAC
jgi:hypothetical protein